jgi:hypothetical protein
MTTEDLLLLYRDLEAADLNMLGDCDQGHYKSLDNRLLARETIIQQITKAAGELVGCPPSALTSVRTAQQRALLRDRRIRDLVGVARDTAKRDWQKSIAGLGTIGGNPYVAGEKPRIRVTL